MLPVGTIGLDMGSVYRGQYEDRYLDANKWYAFLWPIGLRTMCNTGKKINPELEVTSTVLEGKAGPVFQVSTRFAPCHQVSTSHVSGEHKSCFR